MKTTPPTYVPDRDVLKDLMGLETVVESLAQGNYSWPSLGKLIAPGDIFDHISTLYKYCWEIKKPGSETVIYVLMGSKTAEYKPEIHGKHPPRPNAPRVHVTQVHEMKWVESAVEQFVKRAKILTGI